MNSILSVGGCSAVLRCILCERRKKDASCLTGYPSDNRISVREREVPLKEGRGSPPPLLFLLPIPLLPFTHPKKVTFMELSVVSAGAHPWNNK